MLHDLHLDFCRHLARRKKVIAYWHAELLDGYWGDGAHKPGYSVRGNSDEMEAKKLLTLNARPWWSDSVRNDGYIYENLARHLMVADRNIELGALLLDARWTHFRMTVGGLVALEGDFGSFGCFSPSAAGGKQGCTFSKGLHESFALIFRALQLSWGRISGGRRELLFQMCGRLVKLRKGNVFLNKYLESLSLYTEKPYLVPVTAFFPDPRSGELMDIQVGENCDAVCCSPCGRYIAASTSSDVVVLDALSGAILSRLEGHLVARCLQFAPDSKTVIAPHRDNAIMLWTRESCSSPKRLLKGHGGAVTCVAISSDGERIFSGSVDRTLRVWDTASGEETRKYAQSSSVVCLSLSSDDVKIALGLWDGMLRVLDSRSGAVIFENQDAGKKYVESVAFCPNTQHLASGSSTNISLWNTETWRLTGTLRTGSANSVAFSPSGKKIVVGSTACSISLWNVETKVAVGTSPNVRSPVKSVAFSCDGKRIISGCRDGRVRIWDSKLQCGYFSNHIVEASDENVRAVAICRDGMLVASVSSDRSVRIWDACTGSQIGKPLGKGCVRCISFSPDGRRLVSGHLDGTLWLWDVEASRAVGDAMRGHTDIVSCVAFSRDGRRIISGSWDETVRMWDATSQTPIRGPLEGYKTVRHVAESVCGMYIVSSHVDSNSRLCIRNRSDGEIVWTMKKNCRSENKIGSEEAHQIIRSCSYETSLFWPSELPHEYDEVYVEGTQMYANVFGKPVLLGSIPGAEVPVNWKYNAKRGVCAAGVGSGGGGLAICTAVFD